MLSRDDDLTLMAQQSLIYDIIKNFFNTNLARNANLSGIHVKIEKGCVNAEWEFNIREENDIKE